MSSLKSLIGAGGGDIDHTFVDEQVLPFFPPGSSTLSITTGRDIIYPFVLPTGLDVDTLVLPISGSSGGNVAVGIYDAGDGNTITLRTDALLTTVPASSGIQQISTTTYGLEKGTLYYCCVNAASAIVACVTTVATANNSWRMLPHYPDNISASYPSLYPVYEKTRSTAALPSTQDLSTFSAQGSFRFPCVYGGKTA